MDEINRRTRLPPDQRDLTKEEADAIVAAVLGATNTTTQRTSSETMEWILKMDINEEVMVEAGTHYAIVKALGEWEDRVAIRNISRSARFLAHLYLEDEKVQLFELLVPHMNDSDGVSDKTDFVLGCTLYELTDGDPLARQRLRDIPDVLQKLDVFERHIEYYNLGLRKFLNRMRSLSPSGKMTKAVRT